MNAHTATRRAIDRVVFLVLAGGLSLAAPVLVGCEEKTGTPPPAMPGGGAGKTGASGAATSTGPSNIRVSTLMPPTQTPSGTYTVKGIVESLPTIDKPQSELRVHHEAIDDFADRDGKVVGMNSMTMEFPPAKGVDISSLKVGDKVVLTFSVWWKQSPPWLATKIETLPPETPIEFRKRKQSRPAAKPATDPPVGESGKGG